MLYLKLLLYAYVFVLALLLLVVPDSLSSGWASYRARTIDSMFGLTPETYHGEHFGVVSMNLAPTVLLIILALYLIRKRKRGIAITSSVLLLLFSMGNFIHLILSFAVIVMLFTRSSKQYFLGDGGSLSAEPAAESEEEPEAEETSHADDDDEDSEGASGEREADKPAADAAKRTVVLEKPAASAAAAETAPSRPKPSANPEVEIRVAGPADAAVVHELMLEAFEEYRAAVPPSSALSETVESVREALENGESAAILTEDGIPAAMVRYRFEADAIFFFRLSVRPARRKRGYARQLIEWIERMGRSKGLEFSRCKVRQSVSRNLVLYENMGYEVKDQELVVRPEGSVKALTMEKRLTIG